jgi:hypothetical protein
MAKVIRMLVKGKSCIVPDSFVCLIASNVYNFITLVHFVRYFQIKENEKNLCIKEIFLKTLRNCNSAIQRRNDVLHLLDRGWAL